MHLIFSVYNFNTSHFYNSTFHPYICLSTIPSFFLFFLFYISPSFTKNPSLPHSLSLSPHSLSFAHTLARTLLPNWGEKLGLQQQHRQETEQKEEKRSTDTSRKKRTGRGEKKKITYGHIGLAACIYSRCTRAPSVCVCVDELYHSLPYSGTHTNNNTLTSSYKQTSKLRVQMPVSKVMY